MDKKELYDQLKAYLDFNKENLTHKDQKIPLERSQKYFSPQDGFSKFEVFFEILKNKLSYVEAVYLLDKHHYHFDKTSQFDLIVEYCIKEGIYEIHKVNDLLMHFIGEKINTP